MLRTKEGSWNKPIYRGRRKDIERSFCVFQARFGIRRQEDRGWYKGNIFDSSNACVTLNNLLVRVNGGG